MAISYEPGEPIELESSSKRKFYSKALSWREQKQLVSEVESKEFNELSNDEQIDKAIGILAERITKTEPPADISEETLGDILDERQVWELFVAMRRNLTAEEKKSSE